MRLVRELESDAAASELEDALDDHGITTHRSDTREGGVSVWIVDEVDLPRARALSDAWYAPDGQPELSAAARRGRARREVRERIAQRAQLQQALLKHHMRALPRPRPTPLTWGLVALCVAVFAVMQIFVFRGTYTLQDMMAPLTITDPRVPLLGHVVSLFGLQIPWLPLPWHEPWRLLTPAIVHLDWMHIFFNMLVLKDVGRVIELSHGTRYLAGFVVVSGVLSNIAQYEIVRSPMFAGMSGVVYGLLAVIWLGGRLDPGVGYALPRSTLQLMLVGLGLGFLGNFGVANYCHLAGLIVGLIWAYAAHLIRQRQKRAA